MLLDNTQDVWLNRGEPEREPVDMGYTNHTWIYTTEVLTLAQKASSAPPPLSSSTVMLETRFPFLDASVLFHYLKLRKVWRIEKKTVFVWDEMNLLGCGARWVIAEEEENKRKMKVGNNQQWWWLGWRSTHILMRWNAYVREDEEVNEWEWEREERMEGVVLLNVTAGNVADCCVCVFSCVLCCVVKLWVSERESPSQKRRNEPKEGRRERDILFEYLRKWTQRFRDMDPTKLQNYLS